MDNISVPRDMLSEICDMLHRIDDEADYNLHGHYSVTAMRTRILRLLASTSPVAEIVLQDQHTKETIPWNPAIWDEPMQPVRPARQGVVQKMTPDTTTPPTPDSTGKSGAVDDARASMVRWYRTPTGERLPGCPHCGSFRTYYQPAPLNFRCMDCNAGFYSEIPE